MHHSVLNFESEIVDGGGEIWKGKTERTLLRLVKETDLASVGAIEKWREIGTKN